ncbi:hypothetical protein QCA50_011223 [Cerrena zonata]|uniref:EF-hand domain-containing protein n=1 Tax=Cerrena zonata TaxID=2478898 RepID=A0AAW0G8B1_9APHY
MGRLQRILHRFKLILHVSRPPHGKDDYGTKAPKPSNSKRKAVTSDIFIQAEAIDNLVADNGRSLTNELTPDKTDAHVESGRGPGGQTGADRSDEDRGQDTTGDDEKTSHVRRSPHKFTEPQASRGGGEGSTTDVAGKPIELDIDSNSASGSSKGKEKKRESQNAIEVTIELPDTVFDSTSEEYQNILESEINNFSENFATLVTIFNDIADLHPAAKAVITVFKVVYELEMQRRENDRRIRVVYIHMKDMVHVLSRLKDTTPSVQEICKKIEGNIKTCANVCDAFRRQRPLVRFLQASVWAEKFRSLIKGFANRRKELLLSLGMDTSMQIRSLDVKIGKLSKLITGYMTQTELKIAESIRKEQLPERYESYEKDSQLRKLIEAVYPDTSRKGIGGVPGGARLDIQELREILQQKVDIVIKNNTQTFEREFALCQSKMGEILAAVKGGPHEMIKDKELQKLWEDMKWRWNVKSKTFVMTLREHFQDQLLGMKLRAKATHLEGDEEEHDVLDRWAYSYISLAWLQPLLDAFDHDGSGYVTVMEINRFTDEKPDEIQWSLQHWIAYWAVGWQISASEYRSAILGFLTDMFDMLPKLHPYNRRGGDYYLHSIWPWVMQLLMALNTDGLPDLRHKFVDFSRYEKKRIASHLEKVNYEISSQEMVSVITGEHVEKHVLTLIFLLMQRNHHMFLQARNKVVQYSGIQKAVNSLLYVFAAIQLRVSDLEELARQQHIDVNDRMNRMASGLLRYYHDSSELWAMSNLSSRRLRYLEPGDVPPEDSDIPNDANFDNLFTSDNLPSIDVSAYETQLESVPGFQLTFDPYVVPRGELNSPLIHLLGTWSGFFYAAGDTRLSNDWIGRSLDVLHEVRIEPETSLESGSFVGYHTGSSRESWCIKGTCMRNKQGQIEVEFGLYYEGIPESGRYHGTIDEANTLISHSTDFGLDSDSESYSDSDSDLDSDLDWNLYHHYHHDRPRFMLRRIPAHMMVFYPPSSQLKRNRARALWFFAIRSILEDVRRRAWSWSYFRERIEKRRGYVEFGVSNKIVKRFTEDYKRFRLEKGTLLFQDALYYSSLSQHVHAIIPRHQNRICDSCDQRLWRDKIMCLDCKPETEPISQYLEFCDLNCWRQHVSSRTLGNIHRHNHDIVKIRTHLHDRNRPTLDYEARVALRYARLVWQPAPVPSSLEDLDITIKVEPAVMLVSRSVSQDPKCGICAKALAVDCWYCVTCHNFYRTKHLFICDKCEETMLLACDNCKTPYMQPGYFYGSDPKDKFLCSGCTFRNISPRKSARETQHVYTHVLARVKEHIDDPIESPQLSINDRITSLEERIRGQTTLIEEFIASLRDKTDAHPSSAANLSSSTTIN